MEFKSIHRPTSRTEKTCLACWSREVDFVPTLTSSFLAERAWGGRPERTLLIRCRHCDFRYFERGLSASEAANYYREYREDSYVAGRSRHEWFYTKRLHESLTQWMESSERTERLADLLKKCGYSAFDRVLDYGGGTGYLIANLRAERKSVVDMSGVDPLPGIEVYTDASLLPASAFDLIVCAQTLEHCSDPLTEMSRIENALTPSGLLYLELPNEIWRGNFQPRPWQRRLTDGVIAAALASPLIMKILDFLFTGIRTKLRVLPFFGFVPMREHLNYFTLKSLESLAANFSLEVIAREASSPYILARKRQSA